MFTFIGLLNIKSFRTKSSNKKNKISMKNFKENTIKKYDVIVVGGGHSGFEAAMASCKRGSSTLLITLNLDKIGWQPCNPSIGGPAKSTLVHEVDALGGGMAKVADRCYLHKRLLNCSKGPAVWSLRAQTDTLGTESNLVRTNNHNIN